MGFNHNKHTHTWLFTAGDNQHISGINTVAVGGNALQECTQVCDAECALHMWVSVFEDNNLLTICGSSACRLLDPNHIISVWQQKAKNHRSGRENT